MKKRIAILLMFLLLLQAIPVVQLLVPDEAGYTWVDEDKPDDGKIKEKKDSKYFLIQATQPGLEPATLPVYGVAPLHCLPCPYLETFTPPPNGAC